MKKYIGYAGAAYVVYLLYKNRAKTPSDKFKMPPIGQLALGSLAAAYGFGLLG